MEKNQKIAICRICLKTVDPRWCKSLKPEAVYDGKLVLKILNFCIPEMFIDLSLECPKVCRKCLQNLNSFYKFKNMCLKNDLKYKNGSNEISSNDSSDNMPSTSSNIINRSTPENNTALDNIHGDTSTDINQNETSAANGTVASRAAFNKEGVKKKNLPPYRKRFTNTECIGCRNHLRDAKYHSSLHSRICVCLICGKHYGTIKEIRKHMHKHLYLYKCDICGKKWRDRHQMELHLRSHTKEKPFECPECGKKFVQSYNLHQHLSIHKKTDKDNQNRCEECGKIFSTKYNLKIHLTTRHVGYRPRCAVCNIWFYTEAALRKHSKKCTFIKTENEIFIDEPEFVKTELPEYVETDLPDCVKEENQSDDDIFIEETSLPIILTPPSILNIGKKESFIQKEEYL